MITFFDSLSRKTTFQSNMKSFVYKINQVEFQLQIRIIILQWRLKQTKATGFSRGHTIFQKSAQV